MLNSRPSKKKIQNTYSKFLKHKWFKNQINGLNVWSSLHSNRMTKADRCEFGTNKDKRLLEQIIKELKCSDERRNLISKPNLTLEIAIENIRAYEATTKNNMRYKDASEMKAGVYHEIEMRRTKPCTRCGRNHGKRKEDCYAFNKECKRCRGLHHFENYCLTKMYMRQNSKYSPNKMRHRNRSQSPHNRHRKQNIARRNVDAIY